MTTPTLYQSLDKYLQAAFNDIDRTLIFHLKKEDIPKVLEALLEKHKQ